MNRQDEVSEPLHAQVAARMRRDMRDGTFSPGQRLPPEVDLARSLGVSRGTLRQALRSLLDDGLIDTVPGRGTFVRDGSNDRAAGLIGLIMPSVVRVRNLELIGGVEETLRESGYSLVLGISGNDRWLETEQIQRIVAQGATGLIVYVVDGSPELPSIRRLVDRGFPIVLIDRWVPDIAVDAVTMDNMGGAYLAVQHLAQQGYDRIGYIGTDNLGTSSIVERMSGYRWALAQYGLPYSADLVCTDIIRLLAWPPREADKEQHNLAVMRAFLSRPGRPDAVYVCNDFVAFQVVQAAEQLGLRIPHDLAIVGHDNVSYTDYFGVPLTTVDQPRHEIGVTAASLLLDRIAGRRMRLDRVVVSTRLIVRRSSTKPSDTTSTATPTHQFAPALP